MQERTRVVSSTSREKVGRDAPKKAGRRTQGSLFRLSVGLYEGNQGMKLTV